MMPTTSVRRRDLLVEALLRVGPDLAPVFAREGGESQYVRPRLGKQGRGLGETFLQLLHHASST
jgi:hypothetical protein